MVESYNEILTGMENAYKDTTGYKPDENSDTGIRMRVLAGEVFNLTSQLEWLKKQMFPTTAEGIYLDYHAEERGITRKSAVKATGYVTFAMAYVITEDVIIPKGTVVATDDDVPLRFISTQERMIRAGTVNVVVPVEAEKGGKEYNVATGKIVCAVTAVQNIIQIINLSPMTGGADVESDDRLRNRILYLHYHHNNSTNTAFYKNLAESVEGVYSAGVIPKNRGVGTVDVYISRHGEDAGTLLINSVQELLTKEREVNVNVQVRTATKSSANIHLYLDVEEKYDFEEVKRDVEVMATDYVNSLGVGNPFYLSKLGVLIQQVQGVKGFIYDMDDSYDLLVSKKMYPAMGSITIERRVET